MDRQTEQTTKPATTPCYECGTANSSCQTHTLSCGCIVHQRSVYHDGADHRAPYKDWTDQCKAHKQPEPKRHNPPCPKCGTYCHGDCEASNG